MPDLINDNHSTNESSGEQGPDAHGQAALLLVESVIHGLIARSVISVAEAVEMVEVAAEVKVAVAEDYGDSPATMRKSLLLLDSIATSLKLDGE